MLLPSPIQWLRGKPPQGSLEPKGAFGGARARASATAGRAVAAPNARLVGSGDVVDTLPQ